MIDTIEISYYTLRMAMGKRKRDRQPAMWVTTTDLPTAASAHLYETGGLRRVHVRGHENVLKRLLVHAGAFNLGLWMRTLFGIGTPRGLQGRLAALGAVLSTFWSLTYEAIALIWSQAPCRSRFVRSVNVFIACG